MIRRQAEQLARGQTTGGVRSFHTSGVVQVYKKKASKDHSANNLFKRGTPKTTSGSIQNFRRTAAHSKFSKLAPEVPADGPGSQILSENAVTAATLYQYPVNVRKSLSIFGSFKRDQNHELFKERTTMIRESTSLPVLQIIEEGLASQSKNNRYCLIGERGVGKSTALAQAQALALLKGYVVIPIPNAELLVSGKSDALFNQKYNYFAQPMYVRSWMERIAKGNKQVLETIGLSQDFKQGSASFQAHTAKAVKSLYNFLLEGRRRRDAFVIMDEFLEELTIQSQAPVLFTLDDINVFADRVYSANRNADNRPIYHGDLQVPKYFLQFMSGNRSFKNGAIIASTSGKFKINDTITAGLGLSQPVAYSKINVYDHQLASRFKGVKPLNVECYNLEETKAALDFFSNAKVIGSQVDDRLVEEKYLVSGNGNPRELLRSCAEVSY
jgi:small subunit ribosomal protein S29